jgi:hypothetical protein
MIGWILCALLIASSCQTEKLDSQGKPITVGRLRLRTFPSGAKVWIDGELKVEATPATLVLPAGKYALRIQLDGAEPLDKVIEIEAGEANEIDLNIPRPIEATVSVFSDAVGAKVVINGYTRGETPLLRAVTKPGPIDVTVLDPSGHARAARSLLAISEQKKLELFFADVTCEVPRPEAPVPPISLPPATGKITIGLEPEGEVIDDEGRTIGKTPLVGHELPPGEHRLTLRSLDGKLTKEVTVAVEADKTAIYRFRLRPEDELR